MLVMKKPIGVVCALTTYEPARHRDNAMGTAKGTVRFMTIPLLAIDAAVSVLGGENRDEYWTAGPLEERFLTQERLAWDCVPLLRRARSAVTSTAKTRAVSACTEGSATACCTSSVRTL